MKWGIPPRIKVYEALGAIADERLEGDGSTGKLYSSSRNKFYEIQYNPKQNAIMSNDNASFFVGYLGYPAIAYLMKIGELDFSQEYANALKGIAWKDVNQKFKNDFVKTQKYADEVLEEKGIDMQAFHSFVDTVMDQIREKQFSLLGKKKFPPKGY